MALEDTVCSQPPFPGQAIPLWEIHTAFALLGLACFSGWSEGATSRTPAYLGHTHDQGHAGHLPGPKSSPWVPWGAAPPEQAQ